MIILLWRDAKSPPMGDFLCLSTGEPIGFWALPYCATHSMRYPQYDRNSSILNSANTAETTMQYTKLRSAAEATA